MGECCDAAKVANVSAIARIDFDISEMCEGDSLLPGGVRGKAGLEFNGHWSISCSTADGDLDQEDDPVVAREVTTFKRFHPISPESSIIVNSLVVSTRGCSSEVNHSKITSGSLGLRNDGRTRYDCQCCEHQQCRQRDDQDSSDMSVV